MNTLDDLFGLKKCLSWISWELDIDRLNAWVGAAIAIATLSGISYYRDDFETTFRVGLVLAGLLAGAGLVFNFMAPRVDIETLQLLLETNLEPRAAAVLSEILTKNGERPLRRGQLQRVLSLHFADSSKEFESRKMRTVAEYQGLPASENCAAASGRQPRECEDWRLARRGAYAI